MLVVDELADVIAYQPDTGLRKRANLALQSIVSQGWAPGVCAIGQLQDPRKQIIDFRHLFPTRIAMRLDEAEQVDIVFNNLFRPHLSSQFWPHSWISQKQPGEGKPRSTQVYLPSLECGGGAELAAQVGPELPAENRLSLRSTDGARRHRQSGRRRPRQLAPNVPQAGPSTNALCPRWCSGGRRRADQGRDRVVVHNTASGKRYTYQPPCPLAPSVVTPADPLTSPRSDPHDCYDYC
ncbi:MAG: hypothetical protein ACRDTG_16200 [Pseudonocardiaceae bacterium]